MILVDANLLIYAVNADLPDHPRSKEWLENQFSGTDLVGLGLPFWRFFGSARMAGCSAIHCPSSRQ